MPPIGLILGKVDFSNLYLNLSDASFTTLADAQKRGATIVKYGAFINTIIDFLIVSFIIFLVVRAANRLQQKLQEEPKAAPTTKECPYCISTIPIKPTRCAHCTAALQSA